MLTERDRKLFKWLEEYKAITLPQACQIIYNGSYEVCRRRLKQLQDSKLIKAYKSNLLNCKVYYQYKKMSDHDLLVYDFIKEIYKLCGQLRKLKNQPRYCKGLVRPDAYIEFLYNKNVYFILLEIDYTHYTDISKMNKYEYLYNSGELQKQCYGTFPIVFISRPIKSTEYSSSNFEVIYSDFKFNNIENFLHLIEV